MGKVKLTVTKVEGDAPPDLLPDGPFVVGVAPGLDMHGEVARVWREICGIVRRRPRRGAPGSSESLLQAEFLEFHTAASVTLCRFIDARRTAFPRSRAKGELDADDPEQVLYDQSLEELWGMLEAYADIYDMIQGSAQEGTGDAFLMRFEELHGALVDDVCAALLDDARAVLQAPTRSRPPS